MSLEQQLAKIRAEDRSRRKTKFERFLDAMSEELRSEIEEQLYRTTTDGQWFWSGEELITSMMTLPEVAEYWESAESSLDNRSWNKWRKEHG